MALLGGVSCSEVIRGAQSAKGFQIHIGKEVEGIRRERAVAIERRDFGRELRGH